MAQDTLTAVADSVTRQRRSARILLELGGHTPPATEREWLLFNVNQNLRAQRVGKPLNWNPPTDPEDDEE